MGKLSKKAEVTLVQELARLQTPWLPVRQNWKQGATVHAYREGRAKFGRQDGRFRMTLSNLRRELQAAGFLDERYALTPAGKKQARNFVWYYTIRQLKTAFSRIVECTAEGHCTKQRGHGFVPEAFIVATSDPRHLASLQKSLLPLLADGVLVSGSWVSGHTFFAIAQEEFDCETLIADGELADSLINTYENETARCKDLMLSDSGNHNEVGILPLAPLSLESGRSYTDFPGWEPIFPHKTPIAGGQT